MPSEAEYAIALEAALRRKGLNLAHEEKKEIFDFIWQLIRIQEKNAHTEAVNLISMGTRDPAVRDYVEAKRDTLDGIRKLRETRKKQEEDWYIKRPWAKK